MYMFLLILFLYVGWVFSTQKTQWVRLIDVFVYGPYLIYLSMQDQYVFSVYEKTFLLFLGATTITYNLRNYLQLWR